MAELAYSHPTPSRSPSLVEAAHRRARRSRSSLVGRPWVILATLALIASVANPGCKSDPTGATGPASTSQPTAGKPAPGQPLSADGKMQLSGSDRCPVCGMKVDEHKKFASALQLADGTTYYFCGTGCMLRTWLHPEIFLGVAPAKRQRAVVREYFAGEHIDASTAVWVAGSDVVGPMGPAIVALEDDKAAKAFRERHGGKRTFRLAELTDELWQQLTGKQAGR